MYANKSTGLTKAPVMINRRKSIWHRSATIRMSLGLVLSDLLSLLLAGSMVILVRRSFNNFWELDLYSQIVPLALLFILFYAFRGLYQSTGIGPVNEIKQLSLTTSTVVLGVAASTFWLRNNLEFSRMAIGMTWLFSLVSVPLGRSIFRTIANRMGLWGKPVAVIGFGKQGRKLVDNLIRNPLLGLNPVIVLTEDLKSVRRAGEYSIYPVSMLDNLDLAKNLGVHTSILILDEISKPLAEKLIRNEVGGFDSLIVIQNQDHVNKLGVSPYYINGLLGLRINDNLNNPFAKVQSRILDIVGAAIALVILSPLFLLISTFIRLNSPGKAIYRQVRIGRNGEPFDMFKFRTMYENSEENLADYLEKDPELKKEWDQFQKIKNDPRITPIGRLLRKYSIDELPQFWNILKGEMSLVGPRPFLPEQTRLYENLTDYVRVLPGLTGLWQVSGRNETDFKERAKLDAYYVRNWSIWMDIYILVRTVWVVMSRDGAY